MNNFTELVKQNINTTISDYDTKPLTEKSYVKLSNVDKNVLSERMLCLPEKYITILFLKYSFHLDGATISNITGEQHINGCLHYVNELLSFAMGLQQNNFIHETTLNRACRTALNRYCFDVFGKYQNITPFYSSKFKRRLKKLPSVRKSSNSFATLGKHIAIFAVATLLTFATAISVNAEWRGRFFSWVRNTFESFTEFGALNTHESVMEDYDEGTFISLTLGYVPDGFSLTGEPLLTPVMVSYDYVDEAGRTIGVLCRAATDSLAAYDTEGAIVEEIEYKGYTAYTWQNKGLVYLVWQQDGYTCSVVSDLTKNSVFKVADSVVITK